MAGRTSFPLLFLLCVLHLLISLVFSKPHSIIDSDSIIFRSLHAATRRNDVARRDEPIQLSLAAQLDYIDESNSGRDPAFFSRINIESSTPFLVLEDIEHYIEDITCTTSSINLHFPSTPFYNEAKDVSQELVGSYVITSHSNCNEVGARIPFLVNAISGSEKDMNLTFSVVKKAWHEAFSRFNIEYGHSNNHELRSHNHLYRRQLATSSTTSKMFPTSLIPFETPTATSALLDLATKIDDTTFSRPIEVGPPFPITIGCKHCKTTGSLNLTHAAFSIDLKRDNVSSPLDYITSGLVRLEMNDFSASIELQIMPSLTGSLHHPLFSVPVLGISIPHLGKVGILFEPMLYFDWSLNGGIALSSGFDLRVPDHSQMTINFANPNKSSVTGFDKTNVTLIPFQANISDVELNMQLSLRPRISLEFSFYADIILAEVGAFLDLPSTDINLKQLATLDANANCESNTGVPITDEAEKEFVQAFANLTHVVPTVRVGAGFDFGLGLTIPGLTDNEYQREFNLMNEPFSLSTACLAFQTGSATPGFAPATAVLAEIKAKETAKTGGGGGGDGGAKKSDAGRLSVRRFRGSKALAFTVTVVATIVSI